MKENSPICARLAEIVSATAFERPKARTISQAASVLPNQDDGEGRQQRPGRAQKDARDRTACRPRRRTARRRRRAAAGSLRSRAGSSGDSLRIMPAKKAPSAKETPNRLRRHEGDAERDRQHRQSEQLARAGMRPPNAAPRDDAPPDDQHEGHEGDDLGRASGRARPTGRDRTASRAGRPSRARAVDRIGDSAGSAPAPAPSPDPRR